MKHANRFLVSQTSINQVNILSCQASSEQLVHTRQSPLAAQLYVFSSKQLEEIFLCESVFEGRLGKFYLFHLPCRKYSISYTSMCVLVCDMLIYNHVMGDHRPYQLACERLDPQRMGYVISGFYSRKQIVTALRRGGFQVKGTRISKLSLLELFEWMGEAFFSEPDFGAHVASQLDKKTAKLKSELASSKPSTFLKTHLDVGRAAVIQGASSGTMWALATDPRPQAARSLERLGRRLERTAAKVVDELDELEQLLDEDEWQEDRDDSAAAYPPDREVVEAEQRAEKAEHRTTRQKKKLDELRGKREDQARTIANLEAERARLRKGKNRLEGEKQSLQRKLEARGHPQKALQQARQRNRDLEKKISRLEHDLEKAGRDLEHERREKAELEKALDLDKDQLRRHEESLASAAEERFTYKAVNTDLREEVSRLRARLAKEREPRSSEERARSYREQRVGIFLDVSNLYISGLEYYRRQIDYERFTHRALNGRVLAAAFAYNVESARGDKASFHNVLRALGYEIRTKDLIVRADGSKKGDWDVGIAADIVERLGRLDVLVLGSGDGDFLPVVKKAHGRGVSVEVYAFPNTAAALKEEAEYYPIDESLLMEEVSRHARPEGSPTKHALTREISERLGKGFNFLQKLSSVELDQFLQHIKHKGPN